MLDENGRPENDPYGNPHVEDVTEYLWEWEVDLPRETNEWDEDIERKEPSEPRANKLLRYTRNAFLGIGIPTLWTIIVANPDDTPIGKIAQTVGWFSMLFIMAWASAGWALSLKEYLDYRKNQIPSTYEWGDY